MAAGQKGLAAARVSTGGTTGVGAKLGPPEASWREPVSGSNFTPPPPKGVVAPAPPGGAAAPKGPLDAGAPAAGASSPPAERG